MDFSRQGFGEIEDIFAASLSLDSSIEFLWIFSRQRFSIQDKEFHRRELSRFSFDSRRFFSDMADNTTVGDNPDHPAVTPGTPTSPTPSGTPDTSAIYSTIKTQVVNLDALFDAPTPSDIDWGLKLTRQSSTQSLKLFFIKFDSPLQLQLYYNLIYVAFLILVFLLIS